MCEVRPQTRERNRQGAEVMGTIFCFCGLRLCGVWRVTRTCEPERSPPYVTTGGAKRTRISHAYCQGTYMAVLIEIIR